MWLERKQQDKFGWHRTIALRSKLLMRICARKGAQPFSKQDSGSIAVRRRQGVNASDYSSTDFERFSEPRG
jgi:hypothetical protein